MISLANSKIASAQPSCENVQLTKGTDYGYNNRPSVEQRLLLNKHWSRCLGYEEEQRAGQERDLVYLAQKCFDGEEIGREAASRAR